MYRRMTAFDCDGTLAVDGTVPYELECALEKCRRSQRLLLVTGRRFETISCCASIGVEPATLSWSPPKEYHANRHRRRLG